MSGLSAASYVVLLSEMRVFFGYSGHFAELYCG